MGIVEQYLLQLNTEKQRFRRTVAIITLLSFLIVGAVSWNLRMTGITLANNACCGRTEHQHTDACPTEVVLICGYDTEETDWSSSEEPVWEVVEEVLEEEQFLEEPEPVIEEVAEEYIEVIEEEVIPMAADILPEMLQPEHTHTDACYEIRYLCGFEEHTHTLSCYCDTTADLEDAAVWEAGLPERTEDWAEDLILMAQSQLGCAESEHNFVLDEDGETRNGITRYGQWYGNPYGDWSAMFVLFCLHYAQIPQEAVPWSPGADNLLRLAQDAQILQQPDEGEPEIGSLVFLDTDKNEKADKVAVLTALNEEEQILICGDWENAVCEVTLPRHADPGTETPAVVGLIDISARQADYERISQGTEPGAEEETEPEDVPRIWFDLEYDEENQMLGLAAQMENVDDAMYCWQWQVSEDGNEPWTDIEGAEGLYYAFAATEENALRYYRIQGRTMTLGRMTFAITRGDTTTEEEDGTVTSGAVSPYSINKKNNTYSIDVYALPVDSEGNRISDLEITTLGKLSVVDDTKIYMADIFDTTLGSYQTAYFGTQTNVQVEKVESVWRYTKNNWFVTNYYLAYQLEGGTSNTTWIQNTQSSISLYLCYIPEFTVSFESDGYDTLTERVVYNGYPTHTEPGTWSREGYTLAGWTVNGNTQNMYSFDEILKMPVTSAVTYNARWNKSVIVSFDLGEYRDLLLPMDPIQAQYEGSISVLPTPVWKNNEAEMAFDGWYLDADLTMPITAGHKFYEDTTLYAKWAPEEDGYYVYFMDFVRDGQDPLVLVTYGVTEGKTVSPYTPDDPPQGMQWDGKWYLDQACTDAYDFSTPVSQMTAHLTGDSGRDLYLHPGMRSVFKAIFITYGTRIDPVDVNVGETLDLSQYEPQRSGYRFNGWKLENGEKADTRLELTEDTTFYADWTADYVSFEAILRTENANDTEMTQAAILGTWYAMSGSEIRVKSSYSGSGTSRKGTHEVICVLNGREYDVYTDAAQTQKAYLSDVYEKYYVYNNTGTDWSDEVDWDDIYYDSGKVPYSVYPISSAGDTIINFDYMRIRRDLKFEISNSNAYIDVYKLVKSGLLVANKYNGTTPTKEGSNVSAEGVYGTNISWSYTAASGTSGSGTNYYTLHNVKYGQRIYEVYPVGGSWLTIRSNKNAFNAYQCNGTNYASRREDMSEQFFKGTGRAVTAYTLTAKFENHVKIALMYAIACLPGETADFTLNSVGYKVQTQLCEIVNSSSSNGFNPKELLGCLEGANANTSSSNNGAYTNLTSNSQKVGDVTVGALFEKFLPYYTPYGISSMSEVNRGYVFYYDRIEMNVQFNFAYDSDGDGKNQIVTYEQIAYGQSLAEYQFGSPGYVRNQLLEREGYEFSGWLDADGNILNAEKWNSVTAVGDAGGNMVFVAKWEKISNNIVEYYEDVNADTAFEIHYFDDGALLVFPTMSAYPQGWIWKEAGQEDYKPFDWNIPMYGDHGVVEVRDGKTVNVIRIYGKWDESHTKVVYDPNPSQGGITGTAPVDNNEYTIWQSKVPVMSRSTTENIDPDAVFAGWLLNRNGIVYQPGDHVSVQWPRTMIFTAQWAKAEEIVYLRYDPNGGLPESYYPDEWGYKFKKNAEASVWNNTGTDNTTRYYRIGYTFTGWNTAPDGSGTGYAPGAKIVLTEDLTTLYAQWQLDTHKFRVHKVDRESGDSLSGAVFELYRVEQGQFTLLESLRTGSDGHLAFADIETGTLYRLVEARPPDGYGIITWEIFFRLTPGTHAVSLEFCDSGGNVISTPNGVLGEYFTGSHYLMLTVQNVAGFELPATGGTGALLYILCGVILMLAPFVYGFSLRRRYRKEAQE